MDGTIVNNAMSAAGKDRNWLHTELDKLGVAIENVFMGQVDSYGELTVDLYTMIKLKFLLRKFDRY